MAGTKGKSKSKSQYPRCKKGTRRDKKTKKCRKVAPKKAPKMKPLLGFGDNDLSYYDSIFE